VQLNQISPAATLTFLVLGIVCLVWVIRKWRFREISFWTKDLARSLGIKSAADTTELRLLFAKQDFVGLVGAIKTGCSLDLNMRMGLVNFGGNPTAPAWVQLPKQMPPYGTDAFRRIRATIYLRKDFLRRMPFETVASVIAHEMAHIVLEATGHPLRDKEKAVDLTAMILGFAELYTIGVTHRMNHRIYEPEASGAGFTVSSGDTILRKTVSYKFGYLSHEEVQHAASIIKKLRKAAS
jgi:hypothetical protein